MIEYVVETFRCGEYKNFTAFTDLVKARRKAAQVSKKSDDVSYIVAMRDGQRIGHMVYGDGKFLRQEGDGF